MLRRLACVALAMCSPVLGGGYVEVLTKENFDARVKETELMLVKFYAPWCGHCKAMAPAYEEAASRLHPSIPLGEVDATTEPELTQTYGVRGYPTLKVFRYGVASDYGGTRDASSIVSYMTKEQEKGSPPPVDSSGPLLAKLCRNEQCTNPKYPLIDYNEDTKKCYCSGHPCWDDNGQTHMCDDESFPYIHFSYEEDGKLNCGCAATPHYGSTYISKVKCPGQHCESGDGPMQLDFDPVENKCVCRSHPCTNVDGVAHSCDENGKFPILQYREELQDGELKQVCYCAAKYDPPKQTDEL